MTAVRLRGSDHNERALEVYRRHIDGGETIQDLAQEYGCHYDVMRRWIKTGKKHALPDLDDKVGWFKLIVQDQGARLEDAKDADSVRIADLLSKLMGVGSVEELRRQMVQLEHAKVVLIAEAFDRTIADMPDRKALRAMFVRELEAVDV
jgi:transposase-like protein